MLANTRMCMFASIALAPRWLCTGLENLFVASLLAAARMPEGKKVQTDTDENSDFIRNSYSEAEK